MLKNSKVLITCLLATLFMFTLPASSYAGSSLLDYVMGNVKEKNQPIKNQAPQWKWKFKKCQLPVYHDYKFDKNGCSKNELKKGKVEICQQVNIKNKTWVTKLCVAQPAANKLLGIKIGPSGMNNSQLLSYYSPLKFYQDKDKDNYGSVSNSVTECLPPDGYVEQSGDCNDNKSTVNPGMADGCPADGIDNNCDGIVDNGLTTVFTDLDGDTYGDTQTQRMDCPSATTATRGGDCDDTNSEVNPGAVEVACDGIDNDCSAGDLIQGNLTYPDADNDGFGDANAVGVQACSGIENKLDCNDGAAGVNPSATEICNDGIDNNCDGLTDAQDTVACGNVVPAKCPQVHIDFTSQLDGLVGPSNFLPSSCSQGRLLFDLSILGIGESGFERANDGLAGWPLTDGEYQKTVLTPQEYNACLDAIAPIIGVPTGCAKY